jgi:TolB-like protein
MTDGSRGSYAFGPFWLDPEEKAVRLGGRPIAITPKVFEMLAVLPFVNLSGDPADEFIADSMTEELTGQLCGSSRTDSV